MLHSCGWLEGGLVASFEKFVLDADQLGALQRLASGVAVTDETLAMDAIREVGPGGHYLGCDHTQAHFRDAFWRSDVLDYRPFETWESDGGRDTRAFAAARAQTMLDSFTPPPLDAGILEALEDYTARKKAGMVDALS